MYNKIKKIHLIGIGGIGMSAIAELLLREGYRVSGSDLKANEIVKGLISRGVKFYQGHAKENVLDTELVVYSSAINRENPEIIQGTSQQIPIISRAEMLAELMRLKYGIAVAGAHGKTTTTSMIATILMEAAIDPTIVVGGRMDNFGGTNARLGSGEFMVVEADESDGSFNKLSPSIAVVTNMDREHMDYYKTMPRLKKAFLSFLNKVPFYGLSVICGDDPYLRVLSSKIERRKKTYGFRQENHYRVLSYFSQTDKTVSQIQVGPETFELNLQVPGRHNVLNALAALIVAEELSIDRDIALSALSKFQGVQRRFQRRGEKDGVLFIDDYAHHPSEIRATLKAARERFGGKKIRAVFQPHRFSRVEDLLDQFSTCFKDCDSIAVTDIYGASEIPIPGLESSVLVDNILQFGHPNAFYTKTPIEGIEQLLQESQPGDVILTLGAGDLPNVYKQLF
ncbi:MAG: UDP-N-acetylmuramate--L-alanine ligase [Deltaproteobacteria bacterium]|nr:UDP-N-acetylmuramate--L-alanine ligase [Deltaproteobacteria bacterium]MBM4316354.1 UDP-N-acetylmuramate--L-alanine ligase [Deltaproteobacteria bacterium]